jgi:hypothetical protein
MGENKHGICQNVCLSNPKCTVNGVVEETFSDRKNINNLILIPASYEEMESDILNP